MSEVSKVSKTKNVYSAQSNKITSNALVTLVAAKENCFHEPFKVSKLSEFLSSSGSEFQTVGPA